MLRQKLMGGAGVEPVFVEDVMSTYLYTGNSSTQTITNGIDLAGEGGLVWIKQRNTGQNHGLFDTARGIVNTLSSDSTAESGTSIWGTSNVTGLLSSGFNIGNSGLVNASSGTYASWTFRKQPKFFDVVTYTGTGSATTIAHNLGSVPGCIIVKRTDTVSDWQVYHRGLGATETIQLNSTNAAALSFVMWNSTAPTSTVFSVGAPFAVNQSGGTYVAYLFAHNAGGFGLTGTDNVVSCGSFTTDGSGNATVNLGYEPQWVMFKRSDSTGSWAMFDSMRGMTVNTTNGDAILFANLTDAESTVDWIQPTATGFNPFNIATSATYIYIAIRRGPMKVPTTGTSVFAPAIGNNSATAGGEIFTAGFPVDFFMRKVRATTDYAPFAYSRLTTGKYLVTGTTAAEATDTSTWFDDNDGIRYQYPSNFSDQIGWLFQRAPGFFDVVCWTGAGQSTVQHGLTVVPEIVITKARSFSDNWDVDAIQSGSSNYQRLRLNTTGAKLFNVAAPTSTVFTPPSSVNGATYVTYLFATCPGVSKVGSYTGTGSPLTINCGFTGGARFVMIKRTDNTGDWYVWDTARGIVSGNDPYLVLNKTDPEITTNDTIDPDNSGFIVNQTFTDLNGNGATYIFLAIA